jgi:hypothetical protein
MSRINEIGEELKRLLGYECVIVKLQTYNQDVATYRRQKAEIKKYREALEQIVEYTSSDAESADEMREIAEEALG